MTDALALRQVSGRVPAPRPPVISDAALVGAKLSRPEVPSTGHACGLPWTRGREAR